MSNSNKINQSLSQDTIKRISKLPPEKQLLLEKRLGIETTKTNSNQIIPNLKNEKDRPLSFSQESLWFLSKLEPNNPQNNVSEAVFKLSGTLKINILEKCINEILLRHESLRTIFEDNNGIPIQNILPHKPKSLSLIDLSKIDEKTKNSESLKLLINHVQKPFNLEKKPPINILLIRLAEKEHILAFFMHHIITDAWSTNIIKRELSILYKAYIEGRSSPLAPLPIKYTDFASWQRERIKGEYLDNLITYWKSKLKSKPTTLDLPTSTSGPTPSFFK